MDAACKAHDADRMRAAKKRRKDHYVMVRAEKLNYYQHRWQSRSTTTVKISLILDKMDSSKNHIPWFSSGRSATIRAPRPARPAHRARACTLHRSPPLIAPRGGRVPKDVADEAKDALKLHVAGVIVHGRPDKKFMFWGLPHMPGNANLNIETVRRSLNLAFPGLGFRLNLHIQFDSAGDNRNLTFLAFGGWLAKSRKVSLAELSCLPVGHTHEDIDALWRFVADASRRLGLVRTTEEFENASRAACKEPLHVEQLHWVHDYTAWLKPCVNESIKGIKGARYYAVSLRESDDTPVMWYKQSTSHRDLYPTLKDPVTKMPVVDEATGGYKTDMEGIEIFQSDPPLAGPKGQPFDPERMDVSAIHATVLKMVEAHPALFGDAARAWWDAWRDNVPTTLQAAQAAHPVPFTWLAASAPQAALTLPDLQKSYAEAISYRNSGGTKAAFEPADLDAARREREHHAVSKGELLAVLPPVDDDEWCTPFWVAESTHDVAKEVNDIPVKWLACFKQGVAQGDVRGKWAPICVGGDMRPGGKTRYHELGPRCMHRANQPIRGHGYMTGTVARDEVMLYCVSLTKAAKHIKKPSRKELWKLRDKLKTHGGIPEDWKE